MQVSHADVVSENGRKSMNRPVFGAFALDRNLTKFEIWFRLVKQGVGFNVGGVIQS